MRRDRAIIVAVPFAVLAAGAAVAEIVGAMLAGAVSHMWWDFGPVIVLASWVTYGIAASCFLSPGARGTR
jgi:hypothetical protein